MSSRDPQKTTQGDGLPRKADEVVVIPVLAEELVIQKFQQDTGGVRATKVVREREQIVDEPRFREEVTVERRAVNRVLEAPAQVRQEGDFMIIPVMEEVLVTTRQLVLKEEIYIHKQKFQTHEPQRFVVRSEEVQLEQLSAQGNVPSGQQPVPAPPVQMKGGAK